MGKKIGSFIGSLALWLVGWLWIDRWGEDESRELHRRGSVRLGPDHAAVTQRREHYVKNLSGCLSAVGGRGGRGAGERESGITINDPFGKSQMRTRRTSAGVTI